MENEASLADRLKAETLAEVRASARFHESPWWDVARWSIRLALAVVLVAQTVFITVLLVQQSHANADLRCRSQVTYEMLSSQNALIDAAATIPRNQALVDQAVTRLHVIEAKAKALSDARQCGYTGTIPTPTTARP